MSKNVANIEASNKMAYFTNSERRGVAAVDAGAARFASVCGN